MVLSINKNNGVTILTIENEHLRVKIAPELGGKIVTLYNKLLQKEFLWQNENLPLARNRPGDDYDSNFWGGIDELLPNDIPESINDIDYPDHGELWTTPLQFDLKNNRIYLSGNLELSGLYYQKEVFLDTGSPIVNLKYKIKNKSNEPRNILWKLHAAIAVDKGDRMVSSARKAQVVDLDYSRFSDQSEFNWPVIDNSDASIVPSKNKDMDFFYLYDIEEAEMKLITGDNKHLFGYYYDQNVFPYQWYFASYGGFLDHYVAILEPASNMPISVKEAQAKGQCLTLAPDEELKTNVRIYAGENLK